MKQSSVWIAITKHLSQEHTPEEEYEFEEWLNARKEHRELFNKMKDIWNERMRTDEEPVTFIKTLTNKEKIKAFIVDQALGNLIGFVVGMSVTNLFSHYVLEKRGVNNLFGLAGRKKVVVNDVPEWLQWSLSVIAGFIALEFINYMIQKKKHILVWNYIKERFVQQR